MDLEKIRQAQMISAENVVLQGLKQTGLIPKDEHSEESLLFFNMFREVRNEIATAEGYVVQDAIRITFDRFMKQRK